MSDEDVQQSERGAAKVAAVSPRADTTEAGATASLDRSHTPQPDAARRLGPDGSRVARSAAELRGSSLATGSLPKEADHDD